jgi:hypothetical protein
MNEFTLVFRRAVAISLNVFKLRCILVIGLIFTLSGCGGSSPSPAPKPEIEKKVQLDIGIVAWKSEYGEGGNCKSGVDSADFLKEGATVRIYDNSNGKLLTQGSLEVSEANSFLCSYSLYDLLVPEVSSYRTVFDGRHTDISSRVDLAVRAQEFSAEFGGRKVADLFLADEFGVPRY